MYAYQRTDEGEWQHAAYLKGAVVRAGDGFGSQIALEGDRLVVTAPGTDSCDSGVDAELGDAGCEGSGSVTIYDRYEDKWILDAVIAAPVAQTGARFGASLSLSIDLMAIGAVGDAMCEGNDRVSSNCTAGGAVHVYRLLQGGWRHEARLQGLSTEAGDRFGDTVGLGAGSLIVGVPGADGCGRGINGDDSDNECPESGAIEIFRPVDGDWAQVMRLQLPERGDDTRPTNHGSFGDTLSIDGDTVVVGAPGSNTVTVFE